MKTIGFVNSHKENEKRIALLPQDLSNRLDLTSNLYFEEGYGTRLGIQDSQYSETGAHIMKALAILKRYGDRIEMQYQSAAAFGNSGIPGATLSIIPPIEIPVHCGGVVLFVMDVQQNERF